MKITVYLMHGEKIVQNTLEFILLYPIILTRQKQMFYTFLHKNILQHLLFIEIYNK